MCDSASERECEATEQQLLRPPPAYEEDDCLADHGTQAQHGTQEAQGSSHGNLEITEPAPCESAAIPRRVRVSFAADVKSTDGGPRPISHRRKARERWDRGMRFIDMAYYAGETYLMQAKELSQSALISMDCILRYILKEPITGAMTQQDKLKLVYLGAIKVQEIEEHFLGYVEILEEELKVVTKKSLTLDTDDIDDWME
ncbi:unnamed protein product [Sympodiomycopsis kandeliae]